MKKLTALMAAMVLGVTAAPAQDVLHSYIRPSGPEVGTGTEMTQVYTHPGLPSTEALDRLNLKLGWRIYVPTDGRRDGLFSIQLAGDQILVQTRSGTVTALRASDGSTQWRSWPGTPYRINRPLAFNSRTVFAVRGVTLYALDRQTGQTQFVFNLPTGPAAPPAADDDNFYVALGRGRLNVFQLPKPGLAAAATIPSESSIRGGAFEQPAASTTNTGPQPVLLYDYLAPGDIERQPLLTQNYVFLAASDGSFFALNKEARVLLYRFQADAPVAAPMGQYGDTAYVASLDYNVYATNMVAGNIAWRYTGAAPQLLQPMATDEDLYLAPVRGGLYRVNRLTGEEIRRNPDAVEFLAANRKFVYAFDRNNRLLILDRVRGNQLALFDTRDYVIPVSNEQTDRLYLAANDGLIVSLHDKDYAAPMQYHKVAEKKPPAAKPPAAKPAAGGEAPK